MGSKIVFGAFVLVELVVVINLINYIRLIFISENRPYFQLLCLIIFGIVIAVATSFLVKLTDQTWSSYLVTGWNFVKTYYIAIGICFLFSFIGLLIMGAPGAIVATSIDFIHSMIGLKPMTGGEMLSLGVVYTLFAPIFTLFSFAYIRKLNPELNSFLVFILALAIILTFLFCIQSLMSLSKTFLSRAT